MPVRNLSSALNERDRVVRQGSRHDGGALRRRRGSSCTRPQRRAWPWRGRTVRLLCQTGGRARRHRRSAPRPQPTMVTAFSSKAVASRITLRAAPGGQAPVAATGRTVCESKGVAPRFQPVHAMVTSTLVRVGGGRFPICHSGRDHSQFGVASRRQPRYA